MLNAMWVAKTGMEAQEFRVSTTANNLANAQTYGFKKDQVQFEDLMYRMVRQSGIENETGHSRAKSLYLGTGVEVAGTAKVMSQGTPIDTGRGLDMMVSGDGYFKVQMPDSTLAYTRNGSFSSNSDNKLVTTSGAIVLDDGGAEIAVPAAGTYIRVELTSDGQIQFINADSEDVGGGQKIGLALFSDPSSLRPRGTSMFSETPGSGAPIPGVSGEDGIFGNVVNNRLEASNVSTIEEMIGLVEAQRVYEMNTKVIEKADSMLGTLMQRT